MNTKMTRDILESHLYCKYKGYLKIVGQQGTKSDYEIMLAQLQAQVRLAAIDKIFARCPENDVLPNGTLTTSLLKQGRLFFLDAVVDYGFVSFQLDGIKRVDGPSKVGAFHYSPMLFYEGGQPRKEQKLMLEIYGLILSQLQGRTPASGITWYGKECKTTTVRLSSDLRNAQRLLKEIKQMSGVASPPTLILNDHCQICEFHDACYAEAVTQDHLSLLRGMTEKEIKEQNQRGIFTVTQLSYTYRPRRKSAVMVQATPRHNFPLQALAIREKRIFLASIPAIPTEPVCIYLDVEAIPDRHFNYLIGALVCNATTAEHYSFWADTSEQEYAILAAFLDLTASFDRYHIFHYGAYETVFLRRMCNNALLTAEIDKVLANATNLLSLIYGRVYFPVYSNGLKDIASFLGYSWSDRCPSGINSIAWRREWEATGSLELKDRLIVYNRDDCAALKLVCDIMRRISVQVQQNDLDVGDNSAGIQVSRLPDAKPQYTRPDWGTPQFAESDFEYINRCAYFDYQREKIYVHTNKHIAKQQARAKRRPRRLKPHGNIVVVQSSQCPDCGGLEVEKVSERIQFRQFCDLRIIVGCIRRVFKRVGSYKYRCAKCGREYYSEQFVNMAKFGHALKSWAVYEHVAHRVSFENLEESLRDLFGASVRFRNIHAFKSIMANYYRDTYHGIIRRLSRGDILHADETEVHLKRVGKGYVWVFTNLEEVLYVYRASRDGKSLAEMFAGFSGVLISDFYAAYDSLGCAQQKCLVHLIRDLNTQLLRNPFDKEFKIVVSEFGSLLRRVVATVDRYGLKRRHMGKHQREVDRFFDGLVEKSFSSDPARAIQERMLRNKDSLFAFLRYDGVPWNNNNAEHAVKRFAYYREVTDGKLSEAGLMDYLVLLSIEQTCEYKGFRFLKFLLSGETDLGCYRERIRTEGKAAEVEVSPLERGFFEKKDRRRAPPVQW
ncbi:MAG: TM0106 family RecB-like putative nuclease [Syntrophobacteraceae bacterium]